MTFKQELFDFLKDKPKVICAEVSGGIYDNEFKCETFNLKVNHTAEDFFKFLDFFDYEEDFHNAEPEGIIWFEDKSWAEREDEGLCWWIHHTTPKIPDYLSQ